MWEEKQQITIYLHNGKTLRFEEVENIEFHSISFSFNYVSTSQKTKHTAVFFTDKIAGYSYKKEKTKEEGNI